MSEILDMPAESERRFEYAGFWIRVAAALIDAFLLWLLQWLVSLFLIESGVGVGVFVTPLVINLFYYAAMESSSRQATIGKLAVGIKVGDSNGEQLTFTHALGRYLSKIVSVLTLFIGYMMAGWDPKCQALHDKIANTYVFYSNTNN
jgi:uncharacterized RDD family membrane protein YckC